MQYIKGNNITQNTIVSMPQVEAIKTGISRANGNLQYAVS